MCDIGLDQLMLQHISCLLATYKAQRSTTQGAAETWCDGGCCEHVKFQTTPMHCSTSITSTPSFVSHTASLTLHRRKSTVLNRKCTY